MNPNLEHFCAPAGHLNPASVLAHLTATDLPRPDPGETFDHYHHRLIREIYEDLGHPGCHPWVERALGDWYLPLTFEAPESWKE